MFLKEVMSDNYLGGVQSSPTIRMSILIDIPEKHWLIYIQMTFTEDIKIDYELSVEIKMNNLYLS